MISDLVAVLVDEALVWEEVWCVHIHVILLDTCLGQGHTWHQLGRPHPVLESPPAVLDGPGLVPGPGRTIVTHTNQKVELGFSNTTCKCRL